MDHLIAEIEAYAEARGIKPATVLQYAANLSGKTWEHWLNGGQCQLSTAQKIRDYIKSGSEASSCAR
jgi:hypothetical protein